MDKISNDRIFEALEIISRWIRKNDKKSLKEYKDVFNLINQLIDAAIKINVSILSKPDEHEFDFANTLTLLYSSIRKKDQLILSYYDLVFKIITIQDKLGNSTLANIYIDLATKSHVEEEFSTNDNNHIQLTIIDAIFDNLKKHKEISTNVKQRVFENLKIQYRKYSFNITSIVYIYFFQEFINLLSECKEIKLLDIDNDLLTFVIASLDDRVETEKLILFRNRMLTNLLDSFTEKKALVEALERIYTIHNLSTEKEQSIFLFLALYISEKVKVFDTSDEENCSLLLLHIKFISSSDMKFLFILNSNSIINYLFETRVNNRDNYNRVIQQLVKSKSVPEYFLHTLGDLTNEENYLKSVDLYFDLIDEMYISRGNKNSQVILYMANIYINLIIKLKASSHDKNKDTLFSIEQFLENTVKSISEDFTPELALFLSHFIDNLVVEQDVFSFLFRLSVKNIESSDAKVTKSISHVFGWYLFKKIEEYDKLTVEDSLKLKRNTKDIFQFYRLVCDYSDTNTITFVGTIFVVNGVMIELLSNKYPKNRDILDFKKDFQVKIKDLSKVQVSSLKKSYEIRKFIIESFFTSYKKEEIDNAKKEFNNFISSIN